MGRAQAEPRDRRPLPLTSLLGRLVVCLAHEPAVLHEIELVARGQLPLAHDAGEAVQVVHEVLGAAHHLRGRDAQLARSALGPETPAGRTGRGSEHGRSFAGSGWENRGTGAGRFLAEGFLALPLVAETTRRDYREGDPEALGHTAVLCGRIPEVNSEGQSPGHWDRSANP